MTGNVVIWLCNIPKRIAEKRRKKIAIELENTRKFEEGKRKENEEKVYKARKANREMNDKLLAEAKKRRDDVIKSALEKKSRRDLSRILEGIESCAGVHDNTAIRIGDEVISVGDLRRRVNE